MNSEGPSKIASTSVSQNKLVYTSKTERNLPAVYIFQNGNRCLFLGADNVAAPVLGYADNVTFDIDSLPPQLKSWLEEYASQIQYAVDHEIGEYKVMPESAGTVRPMISPLVSTKWNQEAPYNQDCPVFDGQLTVTGCIATSMAQAMNYFKYPEKGTGNISYVSREYNKTLMMNFSKTPFDWENMLDEYKKGRYSETEASAVAYLMKSCGYSVKMDYTPEESGAYSVDIANALKTYFLYDKGTHYLTRNFFAPDEWEEMVYDNLKNVGPLIYNGASSVAGGHSFICDGYDGNGYYHFNWGWGGMSDGYFMLNALSPSSLGVGGGAGGFNFRQGAVFGMQPPKEGTKEYPNYLQQFGSLKADMEGDRITFTTTTNGNMRWVNTCCEKLNFKFGIICENVENPSEKITLEGSAMLSLGLNQYHPNYYPTFNLGRLGDGKYKITLAIQDMDSASDEFVPVYCDYQYNNFVYVTKTGSSYKVELPADKFATVTSIKLESPLYPNVTAKLIITAKNNLDVEVTASLTPVLYYNDKQAFSASSVAVNIAPHESVEIPFYTEFTALEDAPYMNTDRNMTLMVYDFGIGPDAVYPGVSEEVVMLKDPGRLTLRQKGFTIDAETNEAGAYIKQIDEPLKFKDEINVFSGVFSYPLYVLVYDESASTLLMAENYGGPMTTIPTGETRVFDCEVNFPQGELGETYSCFMGYQRSGAYSRIGSGFKFVVVDENSINDIFSDSTEQLTQIFNLQGMKIESPSKGQVVIVKKGKQLTKVVW